MKVHLHNFSKIKSWKEVTKQLESKFFLLFLFNDRRIRNQIRIRIRIHQIHNFGPHGSGSSSQLYGSVIRKTLIPTVLWLLYNFLSLKIMQVYLQEVGNKYKFFFFNSFFVSILKVIDENSRIRIRIHTENVMDPQNCINDRKWKNLNCKEVA